MFFVDPGNIVKLDFWNVFLESLSLTVGTQHDVGEFLESVSRALVQCTRAACKVRFSVLLRVHRASHGAHNSEMVHLCLRLRNTVRKQSARAPPFIGP